MDDVASTRNSRSYCSIGGVAIASLWQIMLDVREMMLSILMKPYQGKLVNVEKAVSQWRRA